MDEFYVQFRDPRDHPEFLDDYWMEHARQTGQIVAYIRAKRDSGELLGVRFISAELWEEESEGAIKGYLMKATERKMAEAHG